VSVSSSDWSDSNTAAGVAIPGTRMTVGEPSPEHTSSKFGGATLAGGDEHPATAKANVIRTAT
jgi:hypothetical protein